MIDLAQLKASAVSAVENQQLEMARPLWMQLCEADPLDPDHWIILSAIDEKLGFLPAALDHLKYAHQLTPHDPEIWLQSARIKWQLGDLDGALSGTSIALSQEFTSGEVRLLYAARLMECRKFKDALVHYNYLLTNNVALQQTDAIKALICVLLTNARELVHVWRKNLDINDADLSAAVATEILSYLPPSKARKLLSTPGRDNQDWIEQIGNRLDAFINSFDWQAYFDRGAHVCDLVQTESERAPLSALVEKLYAHSGRFEHIPHILDVGCGTGRLGDELAARSVDVVLTGIDCSAECIQVANRKNRYDTLLHCDAGASESTRLLGAADIVVIADVLEYIADPEGLVSQLIEGVREGSLLYVMWDPAVQDLEEIQRYVRKVAGARQWSADELDIADRRAFIISTQISAQSLQNPLPQDKREIIANRLIHATQNLELHNYQVCGEISTEVLQTFPRSAQALFNLGVAAQDSKEFDRAAHYFRRALALYKGFHAAWFHLGAVLQQQGRNGRAALYCYQQCIKYSPGHFIALNNLALLYLRHNQVETAWQVFRHLLLQHPLRTEALEQVKSIMQRVGSDYLSEQLDAFLASIDWVKAQLNQSMEQRYLQRAETLIAELGAHGADIKELAFYRAQLADKSGDLETAMEQGLGLVRQDPENPVFWQFLTSNSAARGKLKTAQRLWRTAATKANADDTMLQGRLFSSNYWDHIDDNTIAAWHLDWGKELSKAIKANNGKVYHSTPDMAKRKLRIGYISGDFRMHSVSIFFYNILKHRDRDRFEVYCYSNAPNEDNMTTKLRVYSDYWRSIGRLDDATAAEWIAQDEIDILVDLAGHSAYNRLPLFCLRPAPIQCTYIGYANTTGLKEIDYRFTDDNADPVGMTEHLHSETLVRLPHGFLTYSRHLPSTPVTLGQDKHPTRHYTFACCNNINKVNDSVISVWSEILRRLPGARLLIKANNLNNETIINTYRKKFSREGVGPDQLHLMNTIDANEHQNLYNHIDIALDPFPYNGTTTTCDALWMGVPVLALTGTRHAGRVGVSILTQVGLTDWIATDEQDYVDKAVRFAADAAYLQDLKVTMRQRMRNSPLMQPGVVTRDLECAYKEIWREYRKTRAMQAQCT